MYHERLCRDFAKPYARDERCAKNIYYASSQDVPFVCVRYRGGDHGSVTCEGFLGTHGYKNFSNASCPNNTAECLIDKIEFS